MRVTGDKCDRLSALLTASNIQRNYPQSALLTASNIQRNYPQSALLTASNISRNYPQSALLTASNITQHDSMTAITWHKGCVTVTVYHKEQSAPPLSTHLCAGNDGKQQRIKARDRITNKLLRNVTVLVARTGCPLYVLFVNQRLYALLDHRDARSEPRLRLTQNLSMCT